MGKTFIQTIREKTPILVDSYVSQYGEKYRDIIRNKINNCKFVFYVNPEDVDAVNSIVKENLERLATFSFLERIGVTDKEIEVNTNDERLLFKVDYVNKFLNIFFSRPFFKSDLDYIENHLGIYSFLIDGENDFEHFEILKERINFLNGLGLCDVFPKDYFEFENSELYRHACLFYKRIADLAFKYASGINYEFNKVKNVYDFIYEKNLKLKIDYMKCMINDLIDLLPSEARNIIMNNPDYDLDKLPDGELLFDLDALYNTVDIFGPGLLESFSSESTLFLNQDFCIDNSIVECRLKYLKRCGIFFSKEYLFSNMDKILEKYKDVLPSALITERITKAREKYEILYAKEAVKNMILESEIYDFDVEDTDLMFDVSTGGYHKSEYAFGEIESTVFINPLQTYQGMEMDHLIDHEIRHAIEFNCFVNGNTIEYKTGNAVSRLVENGLTDKRFDQFNEVYTDKLSFEACQKRWKLGQYIFSPKVYLEERFGNDLSGYSEWIPNLEKVIAGFEDELILTRMDHTNRRFYRLLSFEDWQRINELIIEEHDLVRDELESFALKLKRRR